MEILKNQDFLLTKKKISEKVVAVLAETEAGLKTVISKTKFEFPEGTFLKSGKISKGEQYQGLPYWILDFPRKFDEGKTFSFRFMVWWGNELSFSFQLGKEYATKLNIQAFPSDYFFCVNNTPWEYHFEENNYVPILSLSPQAVTNQLSNHNFLKIAKKSPLDQLDEFSDQAISFFETVISVFQD